MFTTRYIYRYILFTIEFWIILYFILNIGYVQILLEIGLYFAYIFSGKMVFILIEAINQNLVHSRKPIKTGYHLEILGNSKTPDLFIDTILAYREIT